MNCAILIWARTEMRRERQETTSLRNMKHAETDTVPSTKKKKSCQRVTTIFWSESEDLKPVGLLIDTGIKMYSMRVREGEMENSCYFTFLLYRTVEINRKREKEGIWSWCDLILRYMCCMTVLGINRKWLNYKGGNAGIGSVV